MLERFVKSIIEREGRRSVVEILIDSISVNPYQPRRNFNDTKLQELAKSIKELGVIQPVIVRPLGMGYELVTGERRLRACKIAGLKTIPAIIRNLDDQDVIEITFIENLQREQLDEVEKAEAYGRLIRDMNDDIECIAERVGKAPDKIREKIWMLNLPQVIKKALSTKLISIDQARLIAGIPSEKKQIELLEKVYRAKKAAGGNEEPGGETFSDVKQLETCIELIGELVSALRAAGIKVGVSEIFTVEALEIKLSFIIDKSQIESIQKPLEGKAGRHE